MVHAFLESSYYINYVKKILVDLLNKIHKKEKNVILVDEELVKYYNKR